MVKTGERIGVVAAPFAGAFLSKGFNLDGAKEAARRLGFSEKGLDLNGLFPTIGHYGTFFVRQKLDARLGHTRALARNSLTAWITELGDWVLATGGTMPTDAEGWKRAYFRYVQTQTGYTSQNHMWQALNPGDAAGQRFLASTGLHIGAGVARKFISRSGVSKYFKLGKRGKALITA